MEIKLDNINRVEVIDHSDNGKGREFSKRDIEKLEIQIQDQGKTMKIFIRK